jgi:hypothetical protein
MSAQLMVSWDTVPVFENGKCLKMPWSAGLNHSNFSNIDLNFDGRKDVVAFDRVNLFGQGKFRCFINTGTVLSGQPVYTVSNQLGYSFPQVANWALLLDYNCDGKEDIFCSTSGGIMVYTNVSHTNIAAPPTVSFVLTKSLIFTSYPGPTSANLYAASNGVPGIADIDGDGDLDVLTFSPSGTMAEYHVNLSKETYSVCDSLNKFQLNTFCWGHMSESSCEISFSQTCNPRPFPGGTMTITEQPMHAGSCLMCFDNDGDQDIDLLMGDLSCNLAQFAYNGGSQAVANITDSTKLYPNYPSKANTNVLRLDNYPCTYYVDVDGDSKKDLIASPNTTGSENYQSTWYYRNASNTNTVDFQFVKKNLFQDEMIEVGQNSFPILFDYDADGKKDLLIGTYGYYANKAINSRLTLYKNTGTLAQPAFSLITRDYASLGTYSINGLSPTTGDIDGDGDMDMIVGNQSGQIYLLTNTAGPGSACNFTFNPTALFTTPSANSAPQLFDIDGDSDLDLMIGGKNGKIMFYKNTGNQFSPSFTLSNNFFGNVNVQGNPSQYSIDGYAVPFFYNENGNIRLLVGSVTGQIFYYSVPNATSSCVLINGSANGYNEGGQSAPFFEDINGDGKRDLFLGNGSGGLSFFSSLAHDVKVKENTVSESQIKIFPNPASSILNISIENIMVSGGSVELLDIFGRAVIAKSLRSDLETIDITGLKPGIYFARINLNGGGGNMSQVKKIIVE